MSVVPDENLYTNNGPTGTPPNTVGGAIAVEIGMTLTGASLVSATVNTTNFDHENFGNSPFAFGENPADGLTISGNQLFAALGSTYFADLDANPNTDASWEIMTIQTAKPKSGNLSTGIQWLGDYTGMARIAQQGVNYDTFSGTLNKTVLRGDANFNGDTNFLDFGNYFQLNYNQPGFKIWSQGDFDGNGTVNFLDFGEFQLDYNAAPIAPPGAGSGGIASPEPTSAVLAMLLACTVGCLWPPSQKLQNKNRGLGVVPSAWFGT